MVALESLLEGKRTAVPATIGFEVDGTLLTVRADDTGTHVALEVDGPETVLRAEPMVVLGLASGMLTTEQAIAAGELRSDKKHFTAVFGAD